MASKMHVSSPARLPIASAGPILALWAVPRSMSTAFAKAMSLGEGVTVLHEPFTDCYYFGPQRRSRRYGDSDVVASVDGDAVTAGIVKAGQEGRRVFFKELGFQAHAYVEDGFLQTLANTILIRHPSRVIASLLHLKPDFSEEELGFVAIDHLFARIERLQGKPPLVIDGERFRANPGDTLQRYCRAHALAYSEAMLHWQSGNLRTWLPHERESQQPWHRTLESSHTILPPSGAIPALNLPPERQPLLERALAIYTKLLALAMAPCEPLHR